MQKLLEVVVDVVIAAVKIKIMIEEMSRANRNKTPSTRRHEIVNYKKDLYIKPPPPPNMNCLK